VQKRSGKGQEMWIEGDGGGGSSKHS